MTRSSFGNVWEFKTAKLKVVLTLTRDRGYRYDGDDENGETQAGLNSGEYVAFDSEIAIYCGEECIGLDSLGGSVYARDDVADFYTAHRSADPMNRNCTIMRKKSGHNHGICHYFPDMVRQAVEMARDKLREMKDEMPLIRD